VYYVCVVDYFETSATTGLRITEVFQDVNSQVIERIPEGYDIVDLRKKGVMIGNKIANEKSLRAELNASMKGNHMPYASTKMDWL
jgi:hypothetical protein